MKTLKKKLYDLLNADDKEITDPFSGKTMKKRDFRKINVFKQIRENAGIELKNEKA
jgi:hypothetical protein